MKFPNDRETFRCENRFGSFFIDISYPYKITVVIGNVVFVVVIKKKAKIGPGHGKTTRNICKAARRKEERKLNKAAT